MATKLNRAETIITLKGDTEGEFLIWSEKQRGYRNKHENGYTRDPHHGAKMKFEQSTALANHANRTAKRLEEYVVPKWLAYKIYNVLNTTPAINAVVIKRMIRQKLIPL